MIRCSFNIIFDIVICIGRVVRDQARDKLDLAFEDTGEQQVEYT